MDETAEYHFAAFPKVLAQRLVERGFTHEQIFDGTAFDESLLRNDAPRCPIADSINFFEHAAEMTGNKNLGFQISTTEDIRGIGLLCYVGLAAPTIGGFLENFDRYSHMLTKALVPNTSRLRSHGAMDWEFIVSPRLAKRQYGEYSLTSMVNTIRRFCTKSFTLKQVRFQHNRRENIEEIEKYFGCPVEFGAKSYGYDFELEDLDLPLKSADPKLLQMLQNCSETALLDVRDHTSDLLVEVERAIATQLPTRLITMEAVAAVMGVSSSSLSGKLIDENTNLEMLTEDLRKSLAKSYLRDSELVPTEIAFLLGYTKFSVFNDDFKRWTGHSPGSFARRDANRLFALD